MAKNNQTPPFAQGRCPIIGHDRAAVDARAILQIFDNSDDVPGEIVALLRDAYYEIQQQVLAEIRISE